MEEKKNIRTTIKEKVEEILEDNRIFETPIDLISICNDEGIKVFNMNLDEDIYGYMIIEEKIVEKYGSKKMIFLNRNHSKNKQFFMLAHELGHYFLHKDRVECFSLRCDSANKNSKQEREADYFASILLMPDYFLRREIKRYGSRVLGFSTRDLINHLCKIFGVSYDVCKDRLQKEDIIY